MVERKRKRKRERGYKVRCGIQYGREEVFYFSWMKKERKGIKTVGKLRSLWIFQLLGNNSTIFYQSPNRKKKKKWRCNVSLENFFYFQLSYMGLLRTFSVIFTELDTVNVSGQLQNIWPQSIRPLSPPLTFLPSFFFFWMNERELRISCGVILLPLPPTQTV